jgi:lipopolysaccharide export system permease protein
MPTLALLKVEQNRHRAELLWRLSIPLSAIVLALMAIPLSFVNPRAGRSANMLFAIVTYLIYNNLMTISQSWVAQGKMSFVLGVLLVHVVMLCLLPLLFYRRIAILPFVRFWR